MTENTTIAAIASATSPAAIGVIRLSGPDAFGIIKKCLKKDINKPRYMYYRTIYHPETGEPLDDVMVCMFAGPNSYTGEDSVEVYAHGGSVNLARVLGAVIGAGGVPAGPGEFSQRAFLNGKMDLSRAEAIMDVIHAQNDLQCREAHRQLSGSVSKVVEEMRESVFSLLVAVEASIDFSQEEELAPFPARRILDETARLLDIMERMQRAHDQYRAGGLRVSIVGRPNAGKSSLFNSLLGHERAIVTDIAGTTTDTIEAPFAMDGHDFTLVDTAGLTDSDNVIERLGVERAREQIERADLVLLLVPTTAAPDEIAGIRRELEASDAFCNMLRQNRVVCVRTKADLCAAGPIGVDVAPSVAVSAKTGHGMHDLMNILTQRARDAENARENIALITSARHIALIQMAHESIENVRRAVRQNMPAECVAADLHDAADLLGEITGTIATDDVLNKIFSSFCIGK